MSPEPSQVESRQIKATRRNLLSAASLAGLTSLLLPQSTNAALQQDADSTSDPGLEQAVTDALQRLKEYRSVLFAQPASGDVEKTDKPDAEGPPKLDPNFVRATGELLDARSIDLGSVDAESGKIAWPTFLLRPDARKAATSKAINDFIYLHVEPLLDQAADLLDRAVRDRREWDELAIKQFTLLQDISTFQDLDSIHAKEREAGFYGVARGRARREHDAAESNKQLSIELERAARAGLKELNDNEGEVIRAYEIAAWLTGRLPYEFEDQTFKRYKQYDPRGFEKSDISGLAAEVGVRQIQHVLAQQIASWAFQVITSSHGVAIADNREAAARITKEWEEANADFLWERYQVTAAREALKAASATDLTGVLNYKKRLDPLVTRIQADVDEAWSRISVAAAGLSKLYGYDEALPDVTDTATFLDNAVQWTRSAIQFIIRFARREQGCSVPISIRSAIGDTAWADGLNAGKWTFALHKDTFSDISHVRLRGISATVRQEATANSREIWQLRIQPPSRASCVHRDGATVELDQSMLAPALLGRVAGREAARDPETVAAVHWHNASPIGDWTVELWSPSKTSPHEGRDELQDVSIDLLVAYRNMGVT